MNTKKENKTQPLPPLNKNKLSQKEGDFAKEKKPHSPFFAFKIRKKNLDERVS